MSKILRFLIMGPPGCGKGTISERIVKDFNLKHIASGDILRHHVSNMTEVGVLAKKHMDAGQLVPDTVLLRLMLNTLSHYREDSVLMDGFPRTLSQAEQLDSAMPVTNVMNLDVPFEVIISRVKGRWTHMPSGRIYHTEFNPPRETGIDDVTGDRLHQRVDDKEEVVTARLEAYKKLTAPLLDYFSSRDKLTQFSGSYSNEIWPHVHKHMSTFMPARQYTEYK